MLVLESQYFPTISWCSALWHQETVGIDAAENYQKGGWRNRCMIAGPNGLQRLSIPLEKGKHQQTPIREVRISYTEAWQRQHWRSLQAAYGKAPYFDHYADELRPFFEKRWPFLFDLNWAIIELLLVRKLGWKGKLTIPPVYTPKPDRPKVTIPPYPQVFQERHGFLSDLSVVDLLLCCGKTGREVLEHAAILAK